MSVSTSLTEKWANIERQFDELDYRDYTVYTGTAGIALLKWKKFGNDTKNLKVIMFFNKLGSIPSKSTSVLELKIWNIFLNHATQLKSK